MNDIYRIAGSENGLTEEEIREALLLSLEGRSLKKVLILPPDFTRFHSKAGSKNCACSCRKFQQRTLWRF